MEWIRELKFEDGKVEIWFGSTKVTAGYGIHKVELTYNKGTLNENEIILRKGEIGIWSFVREFKYFEHLGKLWLQVVLC